MPLPRPSSRTQQTVPPVGRSRRRLAAAAVPVAACLLSLGLVAPSDAAAATIFTAAATKGVTVAQEQADARIARRIATIVGAGGLGSHYSIQVVDAESGSAVYSHKTTTARVPASNTKLFTAVSALTVLTPTKRFATTVKRSGGSSRVTFVSGGDPRMSNARLRSLAAQTAARLRARPVASAHGKHKVTVRLDDTIFAGATRSSTWRSRYSTSIVQPVRGTTRTAVRSTDSSASAAAYFAKQLDKALPSSWKVTYKGRASSTRGKVVATVQSSTVRTLVKRMLTSSDNQVAEVLSRDVAVASGVHATFAGGAKATTRAVRGLGIDMTGSVLADGSGLSPANRLTTRTVVSLLEHVATSSDPAVRAILYSGELPLAGLTGTLSTAAGRFTTPNARCAIGAVTAKTGSLEKEKALSGYTIGADGRLKIFSILVGGLTTSAKRSRALLVIDKVTAAVHGCF